MQRCSTSVLILTLVSLTAACEGPAGPEGPQGLPGPGTDPSISGISPSSVFLERAVEVTISGSATSWGTSTTVDFGQGVTVEGMTVASPTALVAAIRPDRTAPLGARDVTVTDDTVQNTFSGGFEVAAPLELRNVTGTVAQGSIVFVEVRQLDFTTPFDVRSTGGVTTPIRYPYLHAWLDGHASTTNMVSAATEFALSATLTIDVFAPTGSADLIVESGPDGDMVPSALPGALTPAARSPTELMPGTPVTETLPDSLGTLLYSGTASSGQLVVVEASSTAVGSDPRLLHLPETGAFADRLSGEAPTRHQFVAGGTSRTHYFVLLDGSGLSGHDVTVGADAYTAAQESEPNDGPGSADALGGAIVAAIDTVGDQDYFAVPATAGQTIAVSAGSGVTDFCPDVDPELEILDSDSTTTLVVEDTDFCDSASTTVSTDGTYFVRVGPSASFCPDCTFDYSLLIEVQ